MAVDPDPNLWDLCPSIFLALRDALDENYTYEQLFQVMPGRYANGLWKQIQIQSQRCRSTPAEVLLKRLGDQGVCASLLSQWLEELGLERILMLLREDEPLNIIENPAAEKVLVEGSTLRLTCRATAFPSPIFQWFRNDDELLLHQKPELIMPDVKVSDSGTYTCRVHKINSKRGDISYGFSTAASVKVISLNQVTLCTKKDKHPQEECSSSSSSGVSVEDDESLSLTDIKIRKNKKASSCHQKELIKIICPPVCPGEVPPGTSLTLSCRADLSVEGNVQYQWICDGKEIPGADSSDLHLSNIVEINGQMKWWYTCKAYYGEHFVLSKPVFIELKPSDGDHFNAVEKLALLIACDEYTNLEPLISSNDVETLADLLFEMDFKVFAFRNLTSQQMKNALCIYSKMLRPGSYSLMYYGGHSFEFQNQLYLQPVDCGSKRNPEECIPTDYVLKCIQEHSPALNVLLLDGCRDVLFDSSATAPPQILVPSHGNTVIGYATSSSQSAHEYHLQANSCFVKYLKEYLPRTMKVEDALDKVKRAIKADPHARNIQNPFVCSDLNESRTLHDHVQDKKDSVFDRTVPWAEISSTLFKQIEFRIKKLETEIVLQFSLHKEVFCNGMDVNIYLEIGENANLSILDVMDFDLKFSSEKVNKAMNRLDHEPQNEVGKMCLQAVFEMQGMQNIVEHLTGKLIVTIGAQLFMEETFDLGFHPVHKLELNKKT